MSLYGGIYLFIYFYGDLCLKLWTQQVAWTENYLITDASEKLDYFNQVFLDILDKHGPIKIIKLKHHKCAFLDEDTRDLMIERIQLLKIARETKSPRDWELYRASRKHMSRPVSEKQK